MGTKDRLMPARLNCAKLLLTVLHLSYGLKYIHTVLLVLNSISILTASLPMTSNKHCRPLHEGAIKTISSAYAF